MSSSSWRLAIVGLVALSVFNGVAMASERPTVAELRENFIWLTDYLEDKLPDNEEPEANLAAVNKLTDHSISKRNISLAVDVFKTVANADGCNPALFFGILDVVSGTQAQYPETTRRSDMVLRTFVDRALKRCDSYHEEAFKEALSKVPAMDRSKVEKILDDKYIGDYKVNRNHILTFSMASTPIDLPTSPLTKAVWMAAKGDPKNTITLREEPKVGDRRRVDRTTVEYLFVNYLIDACESYLEAVEDIFRFGKAASVFTQGKGAGFLSNRSDEYKLGLIRRHFCKELSRNPKEYIRDGKTDFEVWL